MRSHVWSGGHLRRNAITVAVVVAGLIVVGRMTGVLVDWLWFSSIGYTDVFWTILSVRALLFVAVFAASAGAIGASGFLAHRHARRFRLLQAAASRSSGRAEEVISELVEQVVPRIPWRSSIAAGAVVL
ncbi:UPF0182 family protein, partial [Staphylococcus aureus]|uniref:UPF0182 family protein n=1 Tax=Staphylococcus aureus TaxID=1280 RepID=UPI003D25295A